MQYTRSKRGHSTSRKWKEFSMAGARNIGTCEGGTVVKVRLEGQIKSLIGTPQLYSQNNQKPSVAELKQRWQQEGVLLVLQIRNISVCQVE